MEPHEEWARDDLDRVRLSDNCLTHGRHVSDTILIMCRGTERSLVELDVKKKGAAPDGAG